MQEKLIGLFNYRVSICYPIHIMKSGYRYKKILLPEAKKGWENRSFYSKGEKSGAIPSFFLRKASFLERDHIPRDEEDDILRSSEGLNILP